MSLADDSSKGPARQQDQEQEQLTNAGQENFDRLITMILLLGAILACVVMMYLHSNT